MQIAGKTALITGGASGLGAASARMIVENGGRVIIADLKPGADLGQAAVFAPTDVTDPAQMQSAIERFDRLHILINCAGIGHPARVIGKDGPMPLESFTRNFWEGAERQMRRSDVCLSVVSPDHNMLRAAARRRSLRVSRPRTSDSPVG